MDQETFSNLPPRKEELLQKNSGIGCKRWWDFQNNIGLSEMKLKKNSRSSNPGGN